MLKVYQRYAPNALAPTTTYPLGSIRNDSVPGADDGTPLEKDWGNNIEGFHQALMTSAGLTATGTPDTAIASQLLDALKIVAANVVKTQMRDVFYPVGAYYFNDAVTTNPSLTLGFGTWQRTEGRALFGCDGSGVGLFGSGGSEGGSLTHTHTAAGTVLTVDQMPNHTHNVINVAGNDGEPDTGITVGARQQSGPVPATELSSAGGGQSHTHTISTTTTLPPYRVVYIWRRIA